MIPSENASTSRANIDNLTETVEELRDALKGMLRWFGQYPEFLPSWQAQESGKVDAAIAQAKSAIERADKQTPEIMPTPAMQRAILGQNPDAILTGPQSVEAISRYRAMLAAAKEEPTSSTTPP